MESTNPAAPFDVEDGNWVNANKPIMSFPTELSIYHPFKDTGLPALTKLPVEGFPLTKAPPVPLTLFNCAAALPAWAVVDLVTVPGWIALPVFQLLGLLPVQVSKLGLGI